MIFIRMYDLRDDKEESNWFLQLPLLSGRAKGSDSEHVTAFITVMSYQSVDLLFEYPKCQFL